MLQTSSEPPVPSALGHETSADRLVDHLVARCAAWNPMFSDGWGDADLLHSLIDRFETAGASQPPEAIHWIETSRMRGGLYRFRGWCPTPDMSLPMPPRSRAAYFEFILPEDAFHGSRPAVCVHLAGTGDPTYLGRRMLAAPLARRDDIGALILQTPLYGERKPREQTGTALRRVTDQFLMNLATLEEATALIHWLRDEGYAPVGVTGYSMGGYVAALVAQTLPGPLAAIPCATGHTATYPIVESPLAETVDWEALEAEMPPDQSARRRASDIMTSLGLDRHGELDGTSEATVVGGLRDAFIQPEDVARLHLHWETSDLRWMNAGHTTGWLGHTDEIRAAIADTFARLETDAN